MAASVTGTQKTKITKERRAASTRNSGGIVRGGRWQGKRKKASHRFPMMHTATNQHHPNTKSPKGAAQLNGGKKHQTQRKETRQANPTPPPGMKGGVEEGGRAGMEVGLIETQSTVNNEPRSLARMQTAGTPPTPAGLEGLEVRDSAETLARGARGTQTA